MNFARGGGGTKGEGEDGGEIPYRVFIPIELRGYTTYVGTCILMNL